MRSRTAAAILALAFLATTAGAGLIKGTAKGAKAAPKAAYHGGKGVAKGAAKGAKAIGRAAGKILW